MAFPCWCVDLMVSWMAMVTDLLLNVQNPARALDLDLRMGFERPGRVSGASAARRTRTQLLVVAQCAVLYSNVLVVAKSLRGSTDFWRAWPVLNRVARKPKRVKGGYEKRRAERGAKTSRAATARRCISVQVQVQPTLQ